MNSEDLREQLLQVKKAHTAALRENGQFKTRLRIAERECKRREAEVQRLLSQSSWQSSTAPGGGPSPEHRLELAALKRKLLLYERMLHEKGQENAKLMADKSVAQAAEARKQLDRLEGECQRLRAHLAQSVPETEFLREKDQYLAIINRLVEENMHLRQVIGEFEQRRRESEKLLAQLGGGEALVRQFRNTSISSKKQANFYKNALGNLLKGRRRTGSTTATPSPAASALSKSNGRLSSIRALLEGRKGSTTMTGAKRRISLGSEVFDELRTLEEESTKEELQEMRSPKKKLVKQRMKRGNEVKADQKITANDGKANGLENGDVVKPNKKQDEQTALEDSLLSINSNDFNGFRPRSASNPEHRTHSNETIAVNGPEEENGHKSPSLAASSGKRSETVDEAVDEQEEEELPDGAEEPEDLETHLSALYRVLYSHVLRQQMAKVRQEREPAPHGIHHLF